MTERMAPDQLARLVHPKEHRYFAISAIVTVLAVVLFVIPTWGFGLLYFLGFAAFIAIGKLWMMAQIRGNGVRVTERQMPEVHALATATAARFGMQLPAVFVIQQGGALNAFALRSITRNFVVLYADVVALARKQGHDALGFVVAHELAHHRRNHLRKHFWLLPASFVPFLSQAYSRACEFTCDAYAATTYPQGWAEGLATLAVGTDLRRDIDMSEFARQRHTETGFFMWLAEVLSTHPWLPRRVAHLEQVASPWALGKAASDVRDPVFG